MHLRLLTVLITIAMMTPLTAARPEGTREEWALPAFDIHDASGARLSDERCTVVMHTIEGPVKLALTPDGTYRSPVALPETLHLEITHPTGVSVRATIDRPDGTGTVKVRVPRLFSVPAPIRPEHENPRGGLIASPPPPLGLLNDDCVDAVALDVPSVVSGTTLGANADPEAGPGCGTSITSGGVWYSVIGTGNTITVTTCPSDSVQPGDADYDSKLSVFCATCEALSCVGGNDNGCSFFSQSTFSWCSEAGVEYRILVHGADSDQGGFDLSIYDDGEPCDSPPGCEPAPAGACCFPDGTCIDTTEGACDDVGGVHQGPGTDCDTFDCLGLIPPNDDCTGAESVAVPSLTDGSTIFATEDQVPQCPLFVDSPGVWYTVVGTGNTITVTTCNGDPVQSGDADFDTKLSVYCGDCNASSCCFPHGTPGCDDSTCQEILCEIDPFCCDVVWDDICSGQAEFLCDDLCGPVFCVTESDDDCDTGFLLSTVTWCSEPGRTYYILVHGFNSTGDFTLSVYDDGEPCEDPAACEPCVFECAPGATIEEESNCGIPVDIVNGGCNSPIGIDTDCCTPNAGPGCDDSDCTNAVCLQDPFCCETQWDEVCAAIAVDICGACAGIIYPMMPISCGETYCSTAGANGVTRDVDWYKLELDDDSLVEVTATCGFSALYGIIDNFGIDSCEGLSDFVSFAISQPCEPSSVFAFLPAGTWYLIIAPASFAPLECPTEYEFSVRCVSPGACCFEDDTCFQRGEEDCLVGGGTWLGAGSDCFEDGGATSSFTSMPDLDIPDGDPDGVSDTIAVDESLVIAEVTVDLTIDHTWLADLTVTLTHEDSGASAILLRGKCEGFANLAATFDDDGGPLECDFPTTGVIDPLTANGSLLSVFQGLDASGAWTLHVSDSIMPDSGTIVAWTLNIRTSEAVDCIAPTGRCCAGCPADCADGDGIVDTADLIALLAEWGDGGACDIFPSIPGVGIGDGVVDTLDLLKLLGSWGQCPTDCSIGTKAECDAVDGEWTIGADCSQDPCGF